MNRDDFVSLEKWCEYKRERETAKEDIELYQLQRDRYKRLLSARYALLDLLQTLTTVAAIIWLVEKITA